MRAAILRKGTIVADQAAEPEPGPGEVLVRTLACGICGSDLHTVENGQHVVDVNRRIGGPFVMDLDRDIVLGHEFSAEVLDYGPGSSRPLAPGTRVCSMPMAFSRGKLDLIGYSNAMPGGFGERMVLNEQLLIEVPSEVPAEYAALTEPMAVGAHAVALAELVGDEVPVVVGCGPIGLAVIGALKLRGSGPVVAADFSPQRRALAERLGADVVVDPAAASPYESWQQLACPDGYDPADPLAMLGLGPQPRPCVVFECVGIPGIIQQIFEGAPQRARIVVVGVCMEPDHMEPILGFTKEISMRFASAYTPEEFAGTLAAIADGRLDVTPLVTAKVGLGGVAGAFEELKQPDKHAKIVVEPWRD